MKKILILSFIALALFGCKKNNNSSNSIPGEMPAMFIDMPKGFGFGYSNTTEPILNIKARCFNWATAEVINETTGKSIKIENTKTSTKDCSVEGLELVDGDNKLRGVVRNAEGYENAAYKVVTVTLNKTVNFVDRLRFSKQGTEEQRNIDITTSIKIKDNGSLEDGSVQLFMEDNGSYKHITTLNATNTEAEVTTFEGTFNTIGLKQGEYIYKVIVVAEGVKNYSTPLKLKIYAKGSTEKIFKNWNAGKEIWKKYFEGKVDHMSEGERVRYMRSLIDEIKKEPNVVDVSVSDHGGMLIKFDNTMYVITPDCKRGGGVTNPAQTSPNKEVEERLDQLELNNKSSDNSTKLMNVTPQKSDDGLNIIKANSVVSYSPFLHEFGDEDTMHKVLPFFTKSQDPAFTLKAFWNENSDIESFKQMGNYGVVMIDSHGSFEAGLHFISTGEKVTPEKIEQYEEMINDSQIIDSKPMRDGSSYFLITEYFFDKYINDGLPNSLIYVSSCSSGKTDGNDLNTLAQVFTEKGASSYIGYNGEVRYSYTAHIGNSLFRHLFNGDMANRALIKALNEFHTEWLFNGSPVLVGDKDLQIVDREFKNGNFEDDLNHWTHNAIINFSGYLPPPFEGRKRAITAANEGYITQTFRVPDNITYISFAYFGLSQATVFGNRLDHNGLFTATITENEDNAVEIGRYDYSQIINERKITLDDPYFGTDHRPDPNTEWYVTDWKTIGYPISQFAGKLVTLNFFLTYNLNPIKGGYCRSEIQIDDVKMY